MNDNQMPISANETGNATKLIQNGQVPTYKMGDEANKLLNDIENDKVCCIIAKDRETFLKISENNKKASEIIDGKIPVYTLKDIW